MRYTISLKGENIMVLSCCSSDASLLSADLQLKSFSKEPESFPRVPIQPWEKLDLGESFKY